MPSTASSSTPPRLPACFGGDRLQHFRIALGSLREVGAVLDIAAAHGWLDAPPLARERDRLGGLLYGLQRR